MLVIILCMFPLLYNFHFYPLDISSIKNMGTRLDMWYMVWNVIRVGDMVPVGTRVVRVTL